MEKEIIYITPKLEGCEVSEPHECEEAKKMRQVARAMYLGEIPKDAKFIHSAGKVEGLKILADGQETVWIIDEASQFKTQAQQKSGDFWENIKRLENSHPEAAKKLVIEHQKRSTGNLTISFYDRKTPPHIQFANAFNSLFAKSVKACPRCGITELELIVDYPKPGEVYFACECGATLRVKDIELEVANSIQNRK